MQNQVIYERKCERKHHEGQAKQRIMLDGIADRAGIVQRDAFPGEAIDLCIAVGFELSELLSCLVARG